MRKLADAADSSVFQGFGLMENDVMRYPWGSRTEIPRLMRSAEPSPEPLAELWMGAHSRAPSRVIWGEARIPLDELIRRYPVEILGARAARRFHGQMPFLLKILAAEAPLSIQVHPDRRQAAGGFEREQRSGVPVDSPERSFRDRRHKPELLAALTPFEGLKGLRPVEEIFENLNCLACGTLEPALEWLQRASGRDRFAGFLRRVLDVPPGEREGCVARVLQAARSLAEKAPAFEWVLRLGERYPKDMGVLAPLIMNPVRLEPGEAVYVAPGELHAYLQGTGIEIMANSDNVLRAGLTSKRIDLNGVMEVARFEAAKPEVLKPQNSAPLECVFVTPAEEFRLSVIQVTRGAAYRSESNRSVEILFCLDGEAVIAGGARGDSLTLGQGRSAVLAAAVERYTIEGPATLYKAGVPAC